MHWARAVSSLRWSTPHEHCDHPRAPHRRRLRRGGGRRRGRSGCLQAVVDVDLFPSTPFIKLPGRSRQDPGGRGRGEAGQAQRPARAQRPQPQAGSRLRPLHRREDPQLADGSPNPSFGGTSASRGTSPTCTPTTTGGASGLTGATPFNGEHQAGPLAMISRLDARTNLGPLCTDPESTGGGAFTCNPDQSTDGGPAAAATRVRSLGASPPRGPGGVGVRSRAVLRPFAR